MSKTFVSISNNYIYRMIRLSMSGKCIIQADNSTISLDDDELDDD